eukprot:symbB.v1.2.010519.t2/scaffold690.1/size332707/17
MHSSNRGEDDGKHFQGLRRAEEREFQGVYWSSEKWYWEVQGIYKPHKFMISWHSRDANLAVDPEMGNLGLGRPPLDEEEQKAGFRACLERTCVPQVQKVLQLRSANSVGAQFQMVTAGRAETRPDPVNSDIAKQASDADARLLECERQCARRYWPDALEQSWLGTVSVDMAGIARDQTRGNSRTGRFT